MISHKLSNGYWFMFWGLIVHLGLSYIFPLVDSHAIEYEPLHTHVFLGASGADWKRLLAEHQNGYFQAVHPQNLPAQPNAPAATILSASNLLDGFLSFNGLSVELFADLDWVVALPAYSLWLTLSLAALCLIALASPPPLHPPRRA